MATFSKLLKEQIHHVIREVQSFSFFVSSRQANNIAISLSRDGLFRSYLSIGGPVWLHDRLLEDSHS